MKKLTLFSLFISFLFVAQGLMAQAQTACNNKVAPEVQNGMNSYAIGGTIWTAAPPMQTSASGLADTEYLIVKHGTCALDSARTSCDTTAGGGDVIIGADADGVFDIGTISRYGVSVAAGDTFSVVAVGYDLAQVKSLLNSILNNSIQSTGASCCSVFNLDPDAAGFCDTLANNGINGQADVNGLVDILTVFDAFSDAQLSTESLLSFMATINGYASLIGGDCGQVTDGQLLCYGINPDQRYMYKASPTVAVENIENVASMRMFPNPTSGDVTLQVETEEPTDLTINIYNALGVKVSTQQLGAVHGLRNFTAQTSEFAAGMYMVEITDGQKSTTEKLIVR